MSEFSPGLEGVVAVETEIAEPDRDGGALRYRGVDIEELVGVVPFERVWGLLVDGDATSSLRTLESLPFEVAPTGHHLSDLQAAVARLGAQWDLGKLIDLDATEVRADLERVSAATFDIVATLAGGAGPRTTDGTLAERFLIRWRGQATPTAARALDTYWICTAEHGLNASTFTARVVASTGADCAAAIAAAIGALSGPLHGGAPALILPMIERATGAETLRAGIQAILDDGERLMGFGHRVYRAEDPRARLLRQTARTIDAPHFAIAEAFEREALKILGERKPDRVLATNVEFWSAIVLDAAGVPADLAPALFACSRTAGWSAHILEQHAEGRLIRPAARYVGPPAVAVAA